MKLIKPKYKLETKFSKQNTPRGKRRHPNSMREAVEEMYGHEWRRRYQETAGYLDRVQRDYGLDNTAYQQYNTYTSRLLSPEALVDMYRQITPTTTEAHVTRESESSVESDTRTPFLNLVLSSLGRRI